ncbi:hypothetical protein EYF80_065017 [Liparis tanakae]|uniref:Uncharacterized protein n=1 Tax=Liparis tanakae TaxID=230148 RepID=A0A4Z2E7T3_9TELE|nr:hypothetical protein EYF80_065017 [Liparis tanakae]
MLPTETLRLSGYPWCFWGKPTGSSNRVATLEPNVGPPGTKRLQGMETDQPEDPFRSLGQMLARIEEMPRAQAEENRLFLETLQNRISLHLIIESFERRGHAANHSLPSSFSCLCLRSV